MKQVIMIGLDLAKNVFQVHGVDAEGNVVIRKQLRRRPAGQPYWQGEGEVMQDRSNTGGRENPFWLGSVKPVLLVGTQSADRIRASGHRTAQTGRTHSRTRPTCIDITISLAMTGPSTHSHKRTLGSCAPVSNYGQPC